MYINLYRVFCDVRHTLVVRDMMVSCKVHGKVRESRWHHG